MACGRRRPRENGGVEPDGPRLESPHFFKIILSDTLESGKLEIPKKFLARHGKDLLSSVLLKVPGSSTWTIGVEKRNSGTVWLSKGWREFMQHYFIGHGHLVVFKYEGNSTFRVILFNKSASEIDYSLSSISNLTNGFILPKREDVVEVEVEDSEDFVPRQNMRVEPHSPCSQPIPSCSSQDIEEGIRQSRCRASHPEPVFGGPTSSRPLPSFELASEFDSEYPFFKVAICPSYIKHHTANVPRRFIMEHIREIKKIATLRHSDRAWPVKLRSYPSGAMFSTGWKAFVRGTRLCVGNVCVFELIDRDDIVFRVSIFTSDGQIEIEQSQCRESSSEPAFHGSPCLSPVTAHEKASKFESEYPFFHVVILPNHIKRRLNVPWEFIKTYIREDPRMATLVYSGRSWEVKLECYRRFHIASLAVGWFVFAREAGLSEGDVCVFELIDRDNIVFRVSIFGSVDKEVICID